MEEWMCWKCEKHIRGAGMSDGRACVWEGLPGG